MLQLDECGNLTLQLLHFSVFLGLLAEKFLVRALLLLERAQGLLEHRYLAKDLFIHLICLRLLDLEHFELLVILAAHQL